MPEIYVHAVEGRTIDQKRALVKDITDAVVKNFKVKPEAVMVQIMESPKSPRPRGASCSATAPRARAVPQSVDTVVILGLVPGIHLPQAPEPVATWIPVTSEGMTPGCKCQRRSTS
jgi:4-oxalocrotonate tautomerase